MQTPDPLEQVEKTVHEMHQATDHQLHAAHRKYPLLFLFLVTFSVAAIFHGFDTFLGGIPLVHDYPLALVLLGMLGLFFTGTLYKRLGSDKYE